MKSLVVYSSQTGNTKKLAEAVYGSLNAIGHPDAVDIEKLKLLIDSL